MTVEERVAEAPSVRQPPTNAMPGRGGWWIQPNSVAIAFTLFILYSGWSVLFLSGHTTYGPYLSPFYSPHIPLNWPLSAAILVAWVPLGFRATCYYYRKAYYRAYFRDPPACAIGEPQHPHLFAGSYSGERKFPWVLNNFHRYFLYLALIVLGFLWWDTINAFHYGGTWYVGLGSLLMLANVILLTGYTFSCHALRHLVGGSVDCFSCAFAGRPRHGMYGLVSKINPYHPNFAWLSLASVAAVDIYIRLASYGAFGHCLGTHFGC
ncbi:MAG TPA: succinate dehydrogenase [Chloroflexota bacterium]|nr:succinate dehydrogenase [Chloroflexota bacterium]